MLSAASDGLDALAFQSSSAESTRRSNRMSEYLNPFFCRVFDGRPPPSIPFTVQYRTRNRALSHTFHDNSHISRTRPPLWIRSYA